MKKIFNIITFFTIIFTLLITFSNISNADTREVTDEDSLIEEISNSSNGDTISIMDNINITKPIAISKEITIQGNGYTLTGDEAWTSTTGNQTMFTAQGTSAKLTLKNINLLNGPKYGVQSYDGAIVILDDVNITGFNYGGVLVNGGNVEVINLHLGYNGTGANNGIEIDKGAQAKNNPTLTMNGVLTSDASENIVRAAENGYLTEFTITNTENTTNKVFVANGSVVLTDENNNIISQTKIPENVNTNTDEEKVVLSIVYNDEIVKTLIDKGKTITEDFAKSYITIDESYKIEGFYTDEDLKTSFNFNEPINADISIYVKILKSEEENITNNVEKNTIIDEKDETPKAGVYSYLGIAILVIVLSSIGIILINKKR